MECKAISPPQDRSSPSDVAAVFVIDDSEAVGTRRPLSAL
jgi:hypothetical protein